MHTHCTCGENGNIISSYTCCTSDVNYQEQTSLVPQHVVNNREVKMTDNFIDLFSFRTKMERGCQILSLLQWMNCCIPVCASPR